MVEIRDNKLIFSFPDIDPDAVCSVEFSFIERIIIDHSTPQLPENIRKIPLKHLEDYAEKLPENMLVKGGAVMPMAQNQAAKIEFDSTHNYPFAVKVAAGKVNAITGKPLKKLLARSPQDYLVIPDQESINGFYKVEGRAKQFVAMPLGKGLTIEEQVTSLAEFGGIQIMVYPISPEYFARHTVHEDKDFCIPPLSIQKRIMGLSEGNDVYQSIVPDEYGHHCWLQQKHQRCFVHILNSAQWEIITGKQLAETYDTQSNIQQAPLHPTDMEPKPVVQESQRKDNSKKCQIDLENLPAWLNDEASISKDACYTIGNDDKLRQIIQQDMADKYFSPGFDSYVARANHYQLKINDKGALTKFWAFLAFICLFFYPFGSIGLLTLSFFCFYGMENCQLKTSHYRSMSRAAYKSALSE